MTDGCDEGRADGIEDGRTGWRTGGRDGGQAGGRLSGSRRRQCLKITSADCARIAASSSRTRRFAARSSTAPRCAAQGCATLCCAMRRAVPIRRRVLSCSAHQCGTANISLQFAAVKRSAASVCSVKRVRTRSHTPTLHARCTRA